jgi:two-component system, OmpR family, response regulator ArlR
MGYKILIIEDEIKIARFVELELKYEGYEVDVAYDGRSGCEKGLNFENDLIILDLMLPGMSGIEVCRRIRKESEIPIIMLTAKDDISDKVMGLDIGANDYMTKPFAIEELLARIRSILKRNKMKPINDNTSILSAGKLVLDTQKYRVAFNDEEIQMTKKEFQLLEYLMQNKDIVLTREKILEKVWGYDYLGDTNITDVYIRYLRTKIDDKYGVKYIYTVRGVGYQFKSE